MPWVTSQQKLKLALMSSTGFTAADGKSALNGAGLAVSRLMRRWNQWTKIKLVVYDDRLT